MAILARPVSKLVSHPSRTNSPIPIPSANLNILASQFTDLILFMQVYTLEKVLLLQRDANTGVIFLDEAMKVLENKPSATFWSTLARTLERTCREGAKCTVSLIIPFLSMLMPRFFYLL